MADRKKSQLLITAFKAGVSKTVETNESSLNLKSIHPRLEQRLISWLISSSLVSNMNSSMLAKVAPAVNLKMQSCPLWGVKWSNARI